MNITEIPLLATAISIVIAWGLFSVLCAMIHEALVEIKAERGRFMRRHLYQQLKDVQNDLNWAALIYQQSSIRLLSLNERRPSAEIPSRELAVALIESVKTAAVRKRLTDKDSLATVQGPLSTLKTSLAVLMPGDVVRLLTHALEDARLRSEQQDEPAIYRHLIDHVATWFEALNSRLTLWYKRKTRQRLFLMGLLIAMLFNVDSVQLFKYFNRNPAARAAIEKLYVENARQLEELSAAPIAYISRTDELMNALTMQVGYGFNIFSHAFRDTATLEDYLIKIAGLLISGFAASMGAPFWFDLLRNVYDRKVKA